MFEELNKIKGQDRIIAKIKMLLNRAVECNKAVESFILYSGTEEKRLAIAKAFAADAAKQLTNSDYWEERKIVSLNKKYKQGDIAPFFTNCNDNDVIIFKDYEELNDKEIFEFIKQAVKYSTMQITIGKGPSEREIQLDLPKITCVFLCKNDCEELNFIDYSFKLENSLKIDSKDFITEFFKNEGIAISDDLVNQIAEAGYSLPKLRRKLIELRDTALSRNSTEIDSKWLINNLSNQNISINYIDDLIDGIEFERISGDILKQNGFYDVTVTKSSGDFGVDIIAYKDEIKYAIQCKKYSSPVGVDAVQQVLGSKTMFNCHVGVVLTNNYFTPAALELAKKNNVLMWDRNRLISLIETT